MKRQGLRLQRLMRAHGAPGGGAASGGQAGGRGAAGPPPGRLLPCTGRPPASPLQFCSTDVSQPGGSPGHRPPRCPLELPAHRPGCGTGPPPRRSLGAGSGVMGSQGWGRAASREETVGGHSPYLGKNRMWSSVRLAPWTRCSNTLRKESLTGSERTACGTHGLLGTHRAGACRALWGLGCVPGAAI